MPLFRGKFRHKKTPARRKLTFHAENPRIDIRNEPILLKLGDGQFSFESGEWKEVYEDGIDYKKELTKQKKISQDLKEENNLLKLKLEILLDMLTLETTKALERKCRTLDADESVNRKL